MKQPKAPLIPKPPEGANGLKSGSAEPKSITINLDQIENQAMKVMMSAFDTFRRIIEAQQKENQELRALQKPKQD
jgi:hypothetical protein